MDYVNRNMIVPVSLVPMCRALVAAASSQQTADGMWLTQLSPTGEKIATLAISAGPTDAALAALMPLTTYTVDADDQETATTAPGDAAAVAALSNGAMTVEQVEALFAQVVVTDEDPWVTMARMRVQIVQPEETT